MVDLRERICTLNMRQLDRLKLMLQRIDAVDKLFSEEIRSGIRNNDLSMFAQALLVLKVRDK